MLSRFSLISLTLFTAVMLAACGRVGELEPPPGKEKQTYPLSKPPQYPHAILRPEAEPLMPHPRIAPKPPTAENIPAKPAKPQQKFFLDPLL